MAFNKKLYKGIKKFVKNNIEIHGHSPMGYFNMLSELIHRESFEEAQAIKECLMEWFNKNNMDGIEITMETLMKIPDYKQGKPMAYHLSLGK